jgi:two-component system, sensor histidine kinase PdtaS
MIIMVLLAAAEMYAFAGENDSTANAVLKKYQLAFDADMQEGRLKDAILSFRKLRDIADSLALMNSERNVANREAHFDVELALLEDYNKQQMEFLQTKGKIQESELKQTKIRSNVLLAGSIIMVILLMIGLLAFRLKQKNNSLLEKQKGAMDHQNQSLKRLVDQQVDLINEKEWLVKEIHHRVKNNLQIIVKLLNIQSEFLKDESAVSAIRDSQNRVLAMSFVHQRLYEVGEERQIDLSTYVHELVNYLKEALAPVNPIQFDLNFAPLRIGIAQAVPIGLILNEAITNAIKYAFPYGRQGMIAIDLHNQPDGTYLLRIKDNGVGMPASFDWNKSKSLGFTLMQTMAEQIAACFTVNSFDGVELSIQFIPRQESSPDQEQISLEYYG